MIRLGIRELKDTGDQFIRDGEYLAAMRSYIAVLRRHPEDYESRLSLADALARVEARDQAVQVYNTVAELCISGGRPLVGLVACRAIESLGRSATGHLTRLSVLYGRGSNRLADVGARLNPGGEEITIDVRELRRECTVEQLVHEARKVGTDLGPVSELPLKFFKVPLLSELSPVRIVEVARQLIVHRIPSGHVLFKEGEAGESCFMVARGKIQVMSQGQMLATLSDGAVFGEMSLITGKPRSATVQVVEDSDLLELGPRALAAMGDELQRIAPELDHLAQRRWMHNLVRQSPMFRVFTEVERKELLKHFQAHEVTAGTILVERGEWTKGIYLVVRGDVGLIRRTEDEKPIILGRLGPGSMLGLESFLSDKPASTSAVTLTPATLLFLRGSVFRCLAAAIPEFVRAVQDGVPVPDREASGAELS